METLKGLFMARVDAFLERTGVGPTTLGRQAVGDPNLLRQLRHGRSPTLATADQLLFWGWFRTLMVYTLYGVVAGAILRVFMGVGMGYVTTYTGALMGTGSSDPAELGLWVVVLLPLVVSGLMAGMKVGELAAMLVSGSGSVGSGMMALVVRGGGRLSAAANPARPPIPGG